MSSMRLVSKAVLSLAIRFLTELYHSIMERCIVVATRSGFHAAAAA